MAARSCTSRCLLVLGGEAGPLARAPHWRAHFPFFVTRHLHCLSFISPCQKKKDPFISKGSINALHKLIVSSASRGDGDGDGDGEGFSRDMDDQGCVSSSHVDPTQMRPGGPAHPALVSGTGALPPPLLQKKNSHPTATMLAASLATSTIK